MHTVTIEGMLALSSHPISIYNLLQTSSYSYLGIAIVPIVKLINVQLMKCPMYVHMVTGILSMYSLFSSYLSEQMLL